MPPLAFPPAEALCRPGLCADSASCSSKLPTLLPWPVEALRPPGAADPRQQPGGIDAASICRRAGFVGTPEAVGFWLMNRERPISA